MPSKRPLCHAPFANIYIDGNGNVTPCCFNRDDIFGNIYQDNIEEIWNSDHAQAIRKTLSQHQFPRGCSACEKAIKAHNYYNSGVFTYAKLDYKKQQIQAIDFELSYWCNLSCIMCNLHTKNYSLSQEQEKTIIDKIAPLIPQLKKTRFYGGEPLLIPIYRKIWKQIVAVNPRCNILLQTNGMLLDDELIELSKKGNFTFNVSLDSLDPEMASKIRRGSQLDIVLNNLQKMKKLSKHDVSLAVTPMVLNWKEIPAIVKFANRNYLQLFFNVMIQPKKLSLWALKVEELNQILETYKKIIFLPYTIIHFFNLKKINCLLNYIQSLKFEALKRPNYTDKELEINRQIIYDALVYALPQSEILKDPRLIHKIDEYLYLNKVEDGLLFIQNADVKILEDSINRLLNSE